MSCESLRDPVQGYPVKIDSSGSLQTVVNGTASVAVQGTANVAVQGTPNVAVQGSVDIGTVSGTVTTKPPTWSPTAQRGSTSISTSPTRFVEEEADRAYILFVNTGSVDVFIYTDDTVTTSDVKLAAGATLAIPGPYTGEWWGRTASGTGAISTIEMTS